MNKMITLALTLAMTLVLSLCLALPATAITRFEVMDQDDDGYLSEAELEAAYPGRGGDAFLAMDADGDGRISHAEWADGHYALGLGQGVGGQGLGGGKWHKSGQGILPPPY